MKEDPIREYDVGETVWLNALFLTGATVATIAKSQRTLYVQDTADLDVSVGATLVVVGAGAIGGDLTTTISAADGQVLTLADEALTEATLVPVGNPSAPSTVTCKVRLPDGTSVAPAVSNVSAGRYRASYAPTLDGDHFYRFTGTGSATADRWRMFRVRPQRVP